MHHTDHQEAWVKKLFAVLIGASLVLGLLAGPSALAGKKKKKKPVTVTLEESGAMKIPSPVSALFFGITEGEFVQANSCASLPASQGIDGWVVELPQEFAMGTGQVEVIGTDTSGAHDFNVYFYDAGCALMDDYSLTGGTDESGAIAPGTAFIVIDLFVGANATFDLKATATVTR
jgi:hypothetical protein